MILVKVITKPSTLPKTLNLGSEPAVVGNQHPNYFFLKPINLYVHYRHKQLADEALKELTDFTRQHGTTLGYRQGCLGPLCRRANRDECRAYKRRRFDRKDTRATHKPHYESVEPLLSALDKYAKQLATMSM